MKIKTKIKRTTIFKQFGQANEERMVNALASEDDEGRDKLRKASGSGKYAMIRRYPNGETQPESCRVTAD